MNKNASYLIENLSKIRDKIDSFSDDYDELKNRMRDNVLVDDKTILEDNIDSGKISLDNLKKEITDLVIPLLQGKS